MLCAKKDLTLFTKQLNWRQVQIENICRWQILSDSKIEICFRKRRKCCGKTRKCWLAACSLFLTRLPKGCFFRVLKSQNCVVKSLRKCIFGMYNTRQVTTERQSAIGQNFSSSSIFLHVNSLPQNPKF